MSKVQEMEHNGQKFLVSSKQAETIESLLDSNGGGFATVHGYVSTSKRVKPETSDMSFLSRFSTERLYRRKIEALEKMTLADIMDSVKANPKLSSLDNPTLVDLFHERKQKEIDSLNKTLDGDRSDNYRQSHDRNYLTLGAGVKVHFLTEKVDGQTQPVLFNGLPMVESIMVSAIVVSKRVLNEGEYKTVNSGRAVLISNAIASKLPKSTKMITLSLKDENFQSLSLGGVEYLPEDFSGLFT
jgi:hypothetical protein